MLQMTRHRIATLALLLASTASASLLFAADPTPAANAPTTAPAAEGGTCDTGVEEAELIEVGAAVPDVSFTKADGSTLKLSDLKGKTVVLDCWATWCVPCQAAMPKVEALHQQLKSNGNVAVVGVCVMDKPEAFTKWIGKNGSKYSFTIARDTPKPDADQADENVTLTEAAAALGVSKLPTTLVIGPDGKVAEIVAGFTPANEQKVIDALAKFGVKATAPDASPTASAK